jgi:hypothetical protein
MENGMRKIELKYEDSTTADELLDQIVLRRLVFMAAFCIKHNTDHDVLKACETLVEYLKVPDAED